MELPPPGNYWLVTKSGSTRKAIVADELDTLLIHQESLWNGNEWRGDRWWQPPIEYVEENEWTFMPRVS